MKKYNLFLVVFLLSFTLLGFNVNSASAQTSGSGGGGGSSSLPAGCASTQGYSPITGVKCDTIVLEYLPEGCTSTFGYSPTTGIKCDNGIYTSLPVGCTSTVGYSPVTGERCDSLTFPPGCNSNQGYSITTGRPCNNGAIFPPGCASNTGFSSTTGQSCGSNSNPTITVLSPNGGEQIKKGDTYRIKWESKDVSQVYIKLRKGNGTYQGNEREISRPIYNQGYFDWKVPTTIPDGNDYGIALVQEGGNRFDISDSHFTITTSSTQPSINLQVNGSDFPSAVEYGSVIEASWGSTGIDISKTECKMGGHYVPTIDGWLWNDQTNQKPNGVVKLYARHATLGYISPLSLTITCFDGIKNYYDNVSITVKQPTTSTPSITVLSPNGGENYKVGDVVPIRWSSSGLQSGARFGIQLSYRNSGETSNIEDSMVTSIVGNTYNWTIPATYGTGKRSDLFMVRVMAFETGCFRNSGRKSEWHWFILYRRVRGFEWRGVLR
ncbi:MAG: hypothetical protein UU01_C0005G0019 [Parcubacteria group bacterium GW2011_GWA2_40_37]|nr:MAG: hypothetical protein UU01_C0005G0019 [Parcubacteria group bacterium GW2011_GWA2_40_37]